MQLQYISHLPCQVNLIIWNHVFLERFEKVIDFNACHLKFHHNNLISQVVNSDKLLCYSDTTKSKSGTKILKAAEYDFEHDSS